MSVETITQEYLRRYPYSKRTKSWAGRMVHIQTENGVWRQNANGYTHAGAPDAWVLPFEDAQRQVAHCGPEKRALFIAAATSPAGDLVELADRLLKRAEEDRQCAENNEAVVEALAEQLAAFEARTGHNVYAVRLAVDHKSAAERDRKYEADLRAAAQALRHQSMGVTGETIEVEAYDADDNFAFGASGTIDSVLREIAHYTAVYNEPLRFEQVTRQPFALAALSAQERG